MFGSLSKSLLFFVKRAAIFLWKRLLNFFLVVFLGVGGFNEGLRAGAYINFSSAGRGVKYHKILFNVSPTPLTEE